MGYACENCLEKAKYNGLGEFTHNADDVKMQKIYEQNKKLKD